MSEGERSRDRVKRGEGWAIGHSGPVSHYTSDGFYSAQNGEPVWSKGSGMI